MIRSKSMIRFVVALLAFAGASAFAIECTKYLHSNLRSVTAVLEKGGNENAWIQMVAGDEPGKFYVSDQKAFGVIDEKTGKFTWIYQAEKDAMLFEIQNTEEYVTGVEFLPDGQLHGRTGRKRNRAARDAARNAGDDGDTYPGSMRQFIYVKKTGKVIKTEPRANGAPYDWQWSRQKADFYSEVAGDALTITDLKTLHKRTFTLDFVPNRIATLGKTNAVMALAPRKAPVLIDVLTGEQVAFPALEKMRIADTKGKGYTLIEALGTKLYFADKVDYSGRYGAMTVGKTYEVDTVAKTVRPSRDVPKHFIPGESYSDGNLLLSRYNKPEPPENLTGDALEKWKKEHAKDPPSQTVIFDTRTHKPLFPTSEMQLATDGDDGTTALIRFKKDETEADAAYFYHPDRGLVPVKDPGGGRINLFLYDPPKKRWIAHVDQPGAKTNTSYAIVFDHEGKYLEKIDVSSQLVSGDSEGRFVGLISNRWYAQNTYIRLDVPRADYRAATPPEGWGAAAPRLSKFMTAAQAKKEYPHFIDFFEGGHYTKYPEQTAGIYANLFAISNNYGGAVLRTHPDLLEILIKHPVRPQDYSKVEYAAQMHAVQQFLAVLHSGAQYTNAGTGYFHALRPFLKLTPEKKVEDIVDGIADTYQNLVMAEDAYAKNIFTSKIYKLVRHSFSEDFPLKEGPLTDLTYTQSNQKLSLLAVGSHGVEDGVQTRYGLSYKVMEEIDVPADVKPKTKLLEKDYAWIHNGERYTAKVLAQVSDRTLAEIVKFEDAPEYANLLKDKKLTTMVITGSNLIEDSSTVMSEYLQAFRDRGYHFGEDVESNDMLGFLKEKISSGEIDLFDKEAHSDGDEKNLFRIFKKGRYKVGRKSMGDGNEEVVYLVFPPKDISDQANSTALISNDEFGNWIREREKINVPFYYLNSSCWSYTKAGAEIVAAHSPMLREMTSLTTMDEFTAEKGSTMYETIFGFLNRKTWDQIQEASLKDPSTKTRDNNILLFPSNSGKAEFMKNVLKDFKQPIDVKISVFDKDGKPYVFDEQP